MKIFDSTLTRLGRALDVRLVRQNVLASNLANVDTPGFAPKEVDFAQAMASVGRAGSPGEIHTTDARHLTGAGAAAGTAAVAIQNAAGDSPTMDGNRVDLDRTMVALSENGIAYGASARATSKKLAILRYVASDGVA
jgi:flagellar basal-body rod protein FlgB